MDTSPITPSLALHIIFVGFLWYLAPACADAPKIEATCLLQHGRGVPSRTRLAPEAEAAAAPLSPGADLSFAAAKASKGSSTPEGGGAAPNKTAARVPAAPASPSLSPRNSTAAAPAAARAPGAASAAALLPAGPPAAAAAAAPLVAGSARLRGEPGLLRVAHLENPGMGWQAWVTLAVMLISLAGLALEVRPPFVIFLMALCVVWALGIISTRDAIKNFSNSALITIASLAIIAKGVDRARVLERAAKACLGERSSKEQALVRICCLIFAVGSFVSNTPLVAVLMPIIRDWARERDFAPSKFLMPLAYASMGGGYITTIASSSNLMVAGIMLEESGEVFTFFEPAKVGLVVNFVGMIFMLFAGLRLLPESHGGLFRTLKEKGPDMITELHISSSFPLAGTNVHEALSHLRIPQEALVKVFRQPRGGLARAAGPRSNKLLYEQRTGKSWGTRTMQRSRAVTDPQTTRTSRALSMSDILRTDDPGSHAVREIFPVPEFEVLEGGDVLVLSLPVQDCIALAESDHIGQLLRTFEPEDAKTSGKSEAPPIRICEADFLDLPGRQSEYVELVISGSNPFIGRDFADKKVRHRFEQYFRVAILAMRLGDLSSSVQVMAKLHPVGEVPEEDEEEATPRFGSFQRFFSAGELLEGFGGQGHGIASEPLGAGPGGGGKRPLEKRKQQYLRPGDSILVLARAEDAREELQDSRAFLAASLVAREDPPELPGFFDYLPLVLFLLALLLVAFGATSMTKASMLLAVTYIVVGWVEPGELRNVVELELLVLMGCALGLAKAATRSGLSTSLASLVLQVEVGERTAVLLLFLFTMVIAELVTANAAAAVGVPLALELSRQLSLVSAKPLFMVVLLAANTTFANPTTSPSTLTVMRPGGYTLMDFIRLGLPMDLIYWLGCSALLPVVFPLHSYLDS